MNHPTKLIVIISKLILNIDVALGFIAKEIRSVNSRKNFRNLLFKIFLPLYCNYLTGQSSLENV